MNELDDLGPALRSLIDEARPRDALSEAAAERMLGRLNEAIGLPAAAAMPTAAGSATAPVAGSATAPVVGSATAPIVGSATAPAGIGRKPFLRGTLLGFGVGLVAGAVVHALFLRAPPPLSVSPPLVTVASPVPPSPAVTAPVTKSPTAISAHAAPVTDSPTGIVSGVAVPPVTQKPPRAPHRIAPSNAPPDEADDTRSSLAVERSLLEIARTAVSRGQHAAALDALSQHAARFPAGQLIEERESLWIQVLVAIGHFDEAKQRGQRFRRRFPDSLLAPAVDESLRSIP